MEASDLAAGWQGKSLEKLGREDCSANRGRSEVGGRRERRFWILDWKRAARGPLQTRTSNIECRTLPRFAVPCQLGLRHVAKLANARSAFNVEPKRSRRERWAVQAVIFASSVRRWTFDVGCSAFGLWIVDWKRSARGGWGGWLCLSFKIHHPKFNIARRSEVGGRGDFGFWIGKGLRAARWKCEHHGGNGLK